MLPLWIPYTLGAYLVGSIPFGRLIGYAVSRIDITRRGSANVGATNVARELGIGWGLLTLTLDALKGFVPVILYAHQEPGHAIGICLVGLFSVLGNQFSLFQLFRGGKGVSTALGFYMAISPFSCLIAMGVFVGVVYRWGFVSLGSMVSACAMPLILALFQKGLPYVVSSVLAAGLICIRHRDNVHRLAKGEELRWRMPGPQEKNSNSRSSSSSE